MNLPRTLSEDEICTIANDVRTKPIAEVGRHVMPLIHHITALEDRECRNCRLWVPYNNAEAHQGECRRLQSIRIITDTGREPEEPVHAAVLTAFDWSCKGWEAVVKSNDEDEPQAAPG